MTAAREVSADPAATNGQLPVASKSETFRALLTLIGRSPLQALGAAITLAIGVASATTVPWLVGLMVDVIQDGGSEFGIIAVLLAVALAASAAVTWVGRILLAKIVQRAVRNLRETAFNTALAQPSRVVEAAGTGDLVARLSGDVRAINAVVSTALPAFITALLTTALSLTGLGLLDYRLAIAALVAAPLQVVALRRFLHQSGPVYRDHRAAQATRGQRLIETIRGADTVRALQAERPHLDALAAASATVISYDLRAARLRNRFYGRLNLAELIGLSAVLCTGFFLVQSGAISLGTATAAALYFVGLFDPIGTLLGTVDDLQDAGASLARLVGLAGMRTGDASGTSGRAADGAQPSTGPQRSGRIQLRGVSHGYRPGARDVSDVSLTIAAGEHVAIVGASGAGKSTLAKIMAGLLPPDTGTVLLNERPLSEWARHEVRTHIAMVSQEPHVFSGSIRDDLHLIAPTATDDELERVTTTLGDEWLRALPDGFDTVVGAGGHALTPAQAQHLAVARLALTVAPVVILDEATAEAGSDDGDRLDRAVERVIQGRTSIIIAHRLSHAVQADRILVMDAGRVVQDGSHSELVAVDGTYAALWRAYRPDRVDTPRPPASRAASVRDIPLN